MYDARPFSQRTPLGRLLTEDKGGRQQNCHVYIFQALFILGVNI